MLTKAKFWCSCHMQAISSSLQLLYSRLFVTTITVLVIGVILTLPSLFWISIFNISKYIPKIQESNHISLYLKHSISTSQEQSLITKLQKLPQIERIKVHSALENLQELMKQEGMQDIMQYLPNNPLPAMIEVIPKAEFINSLALKKLLLRFTHYSEVEQAKFDVVWMQRFIAILSMLKKITEGLTLLLLLAVILIIGNTLRYAIYNRRQEIQVLKLIGASDDFITRPFMYAGIWYCLGGAIIAILFCDLFLLSIKDSVNQFTKAYEITILYFNFLSVKQAYFIVISAILLGFICSKISVKRQIILIEPYN